MENKTPAKCAYCGRPFNKTHHRQIYCSEKCKHYGYQEKTNRRWRKWYWQNKKKLYQTQLGTRTIGAKPNPDPEKEQQIVQREKQRILNRLTY